MAIWASFMNFRRGSGQLTPRISCERPVRESARAPPPPVVRGGGARALVNFIRLLCVQAMIRC